MIERIVLPLRKSYTKMTKGTYTYEYPRPSVTTDCVIFGFDSEGLSVLLIERGIEPFKGCWAFPGGFMQMDEDAETCARRELLEETGIKVKNIKYVGSQSWPFPDQLMLAFKAEYESGEIKIQKEELLDAQWFKKDSLPNIPKPGSVAYNLINDNFN